VSVMNIIDFLGRSIIGEAWLWPKDAAPVQMWEKALAGRLAPNEKFETQIEKLNSTHFFALESSYGASVYAVCNGVEIFKVGQ
jgi:hypothetical protein